jgi:starch synthase
MPRRQTGSTSRSMYRILFAASEAHPLIKTGGLADVAGSLPPALNSLGCDVRLIMPAYRDAVALAPRPRRLIDIELPGFSNRVSLRETVLPGTSIKTWLVDYPPAFDRPGNPYLDSTGKPWPDNAERFGLFARVICAIALGNTPLSWRPELVHCNDWQTGLVPALLASQQPRPATVFTVHNLAYQGLFSYAKLKDLQLPHTWWSSEALEFHGQLSFIKGGLVYADYLTTVSPTYAREIQTPAHGAGLDGLLRHRSRRLVGILNGIDDRIWNPATDVHLVKTFDQRRLSDKSENKLTLQQQVGLERAVQTPLLAFIGRAVEQKGIDIVLDALPQLLHMPLQSFLLTGGKPKYEQALRHLAGQYPTRLAVHIGHDEDLAHRIYGSADMLLMPSRFEPCGLSQLYSMRYGTVPVVHSVGGLADTVIDADDSDIAGGATGIVFRELTVTALLAAVERACALYRQAALWKKLARAGMRHSRSFSWRTSAARYLALYRQLIAGPHA